MRLLSGAWFLLPLAGLVELALHLGFSRRAPDPAEWSQLPAALGEIAEEGDVIAVAPQWAEPLARHALGDTWMPMRDLARQDWVSTAHVTEISLFDARTPELSVFREVESASVGPFQLRRLRNPAHRPALYRFVDHARPEHLQVSELRDRGEVPCAFAEKLRARAGGLGGPPAFPRERYRCSGGEQFFVGVTVIDDSKYRPRRCIFAHPPGANRALRLSFTDVPLGRTIAGYAGQPYLLFRDGVGTPVRLAAFVDGRPVGESVHRDPDGFSAFTFSLPTSGPERATVSFEISTPDARNRQFCFSAEVR